jgi:hypothetical protein
VVQLLSLEGDTLTLRLVDGEPLSERADLAADEIARIAISAFTSLADLHDLGVVHRALGPEHVLVDGSGQPTLCSFGRASTDSDSGGAGAAGDVVALAHALRGTAPAGTTVARILATAVKAGPGTPSARRLATLLAADSPPPRHARPLLAGALVLAAASVVALVATGAAAHRRPRTVTCPTDCRGPSATAAGRTDAAGVPGANGEAAAGRTDAAGATAGAATTCPAIDQGCRPLPRTGGVIVTTAGRFRVGEPGDVLVVGRWRCSSGLLALLRPATGEIWVFDSWAGPAGPSAARLTTRIAGAVSLEVDPGPSGCDLLRVTRRDGGAVVVQPGDPA